MGKQQILEEHYRLFDRKCVIHRGVEYVINNDRLGLFLRQHEFIISDACPVPIRLNFLIKHFFQEVEEHYLFPVAYYFLGPEPTENDNDNQTTLVFDVKYYYIRKDAQKKLYDLAFLILMGAEIKIIPFYKGRPYIPNDTQVIMTQKGFVTHRSFAFVNRDLTWKTLI